MDSNKLQKPKTSNRNVQMFSAKSRTERENLKQLKNYLDSMYFA